jgi:hypothetical protein
VRLGAFDTEDKARTEHRRGMARLFALQLAAQVKAIEKLPGLRDMALQFMPLGSEKELKEALVAATLERTCLMQPLPAQESAFAARREAARGRILLVAQEIARLIGTVLVNPVDAVRTGCLLGIEGAAAFGLVAGVAVRHRDELDLVPLRRPEGGGAPGVDVAVVRVRAEDDDAQGRVGGGRRRRGEEEEEGEGRERGRAGPVSSVDHRFLRGLQGSVSRTRFFANGSTSRATANRFPAKAPRTRARAS